MNSLKDYTEQIVDIIEEETSRKIGEIRPRVEYKVKNILYRMKYDNILPDFDKLEKIMSDTGAITKEFPINTKIYSSEFNSIRVLLFTHLYSIIQLLVDKDFNTMELELSDIIIEDFIIAFNNFAKDSNVNSIQFHKLIQYFLLFYWARYYICTDLLNWRYIISEPNDVDYTKYLNHRPKDIKQLFIKPISSTECTKIYECVEKDVTEEDKK